DRATRYQSPTSVLMLDIDHFKRINDQYGHAGGDEMLRQFSLIIQAMLRRQDLCGRLGGEEFAILLPNTVCLDAYEIAQRLRIAIAAIRVEWGDEVMQCTASMGVSDLMAEAGSASEGLSRADNALYLAKARGRNQVCGCMEAENNPA
ncbi:MAG TPA: GGDEF domain-containing protein, partial [Halothiobacillus sp.]|nr:GGDEF domain-containing protein [Halothiobacillus sp.]